MKRPVTGLLLLLVICVGPLLAHDFWLIPNAFHVARGADLVVRGQTSSTFPTTLSAVTPDRIASAQLLSAHGSEDVQRLDVEGNSLRLVHRPGFVGQALVTARVHPRSIPESPESFRRYLTLEGAPEALERYEREGLLPTDSIIRRYAKYAKTLIEMGDGGPPAFDRLADHPLEFVPLDDPTSVEPGGALRFRLTLFGEPIATALGHASVARSRDAESAYDEATFETDAQGEFAISLTGDGVWNVRALYILPAPAESGADWDVHWATFVWQTQAQ